ncbi:hypothetical protein TNCV_250021 [Trichonephila clavipes]|nr:hypothetical protein TNCV_250021 [Trichonephila clavipes]
MSTKEREIKPSKRKTKKLKSSGRNGNKTKPRTGLKLRLKFYEPYLIKTVKPHDRNEVEKVGQHEGPHFTSTAVDFMKKWSTADA